jgi:hypothetical protein
MNDLRLIKSKDQIVKAPNQATIDITPISLPKPLTRKRNS